MSTWDSLLTNVNLATMAESGSPYGAIEDGALEEIRRARAVKRAGLVRI